MPILHAEHYTTLKAQHFPTGFDNPDALDKLMTTVFDAPTDVKKRSTSSARKKKQTVRLHDEGATTQELAAAMSDDDNEMSAFGSAKGVKIKRSRDEDEEQLYLGRSTLDPEKHPEINRFKKVEKGSRKEGKYLRRNYHLARVLANSKYFQASAKWSSTSVLKAL